MMRAISCSIVAAALAAPAFAGEPVPPPAETQVYVQCLFCEVDATAWKRLAAGPLLNRKAGDESTVLLDAVKQAELSDAIRELKKADAIDILGRPQLALIDRQTGFVQVGQHLPIGPPGGPVAYAETGCTLQVTPHVTGGDRMRLAVGYQRAYVIDGKPVTVRIEEKVECGDGQTVIATRDAGAAGRKHVLMLTPQMVAPPRAVGLAVAGSRMLPAPAPLLPRAMHTLVAPTPTAARLSPSVPPVPVPAVAARQVLLKCCVFETPDDMAGRLLEVTRAASNGVVEPKALAALHDVLKADRRVKFLSEPTMVALDGQQVHSLVGGQTGVPFAVNLRHTPKLAADGRSVTLRTEYQFSAPGDPVPLRDGGTVAMTNTQAVESTSCVPDGSSVVIAGPTVKTAGGATRKQFVFVTPSLVEPAAVAAPRATRIFHVMDLVTPIPGAPGQPAHADVPEKLCKLIKGMIRPNTWDANGGTGTAEYFPIGGALLVNQSPEVIKEVDELLESLRKLQDDQITTEVCVLSVPAGFCRTHKLAAAGDTGVTFLNADATRAVLVAAQSDRAVTAMQAPKLSQFNGQKSTVSVGESQTFTVGFDFKLTDGRFEMVPRTETVRMPAGQVALDLDIQPTISADRKTVRLATSAALVLANGPTATVPLGVPGDDKPLMVNLPNVTRLSVEKTACVPAGKTCVLFAGTRPGRRERCEFGPPVVSKIPYVNRLFKNVGIHECEPQEVLVLVTPRVVNARDEEQKATGVKLAGGAVSPAAELVAKYKSAVAAGKADEALRHAMAALALDPACFVGDK